MRRTRNSAVIRTLDGGKTWERFVPKSPKSKRHAITHDKDGNVVVVRLAR